MKRIELMDVESSVAIPREEVKRLLTMTEYSLSLSTPWR